MTAEEIVSLIKKKYDSCPNVEDGICYTWWKHEECEAYRDLLFIITNEEQYKEPVSKMRTEIREAFYQMMNDPDNNKLMKKLREIEDRDF